MPDQTPSMPPLPEPVAHMHSNGDFCQDVNVVSREWPVYLYTADQVQAVADERVREAVAPLMAAAKHCEQLLMTHEINRIDGELIADGALRMLRDAMGVPTLSLDK